MLPSVYFSCPSAFEGANGVKAVFPVRVWKPVRHRVNWMLVLTGIKIILWL
jgi:hypothetical protein